MAGTNSMPVFYKDGQYLTAIADNDITIGQVVKLTTTGTGILWGEQTQDTCDVAGAIATGVVGVAVSGDRYSRTGTANIVKAGSPVTICTRGIVRVYTGTSAITRGSLVECGAAGIVELGGTAAPLSTTGTGFQTFVGMALDNNGSAANTIRVALMRF